MASTTELYHFHRVRPDEAPKWWSSRRNRDGLMFQWIDDLRERYDVERAVGTRNLYLIMDKTGE